MSDNEGLTSWAVRTLDRDAAPAQPPTDPPRRERRATPPLVAGAAAAALVAAVTVGAIVLQRPTAGTEAAVAPTTSAPVVAEVRLATTTTPSSTTTTTTAPATGAAPPPTVPPTTPPPTEAPAIAAPPAPPPGDPTPPLAPAASAPAAAPVRYAVFKGGTVHLHGSVPTRAIADEIVAKAGAVVGPANVVDQYVIDPATPYVDSAPLYVEDRVLFAFGSAEIQPDFIPLLDLGKILLVQNPNVTITVVGHTDSSGSPEFNQRLSERRVANVIRYMTDQGIDPARLIPDARGQRDLLVDTGDGQREAQNRRVEFVITGLLG